MVIILKMSVSLIPVRTASPASLLTKARNFWNQPANQPAWLHLWRLFIEAFKRVVQKPEDDIAEDLHLNCLHVFHLFLIPDFPMCIEVCALLRVVLCLSDCCSRSFVCLQFLFNSSAPEPAGQFWIFARSFWICCTSRPVSCELPTLTKHYWAEWCSACGLHSGPFPLFLVQSEESQSFDTTRPCIASLR